MASRRQVFDHPLIKWIRLVVFPKRRFKGIDVYLQGLCLLLVAGEREIINIQL